MWRAFNRHSDRAANARRLHLHSRQELLGLGVSVEVGVVASDAQGHSVDVVVVGGRLVALDEATVSDDMKGDLAFATDVHDHLRNAAVLLPQEVRDTPALVFQCVGAFKAKGGI